ncbi:MAG: M1 family aminopeptidase [Bacteroidota bacterium]
MLKDIFLFEIRYRLQRPSFYVYAAILLLTGILYGAILGGALGVEQSQQLTGGGQNLANSPVNLHLIIAAVAQAIGTFVIAAFMAVPVFRDFKYNAHSIYFTKPINKLNYLLGRYLGSLVIVLLLMLFIAIGIILMLHWPYEEPPKLGPFNIMHYLWPYLVSVLPYTILTGSIFFALVSLTRNELLIYLNAIILLVLFSVAAQVANGIDNPVLAGLIDPTGGIGLTKTVEFWSVTERNTQLIPFSPAVGWSMLLWQAIGLGILAFTFFKFKLSYAKPNLIKGNKSATPQSSPASSPIEAEVNLPVNTLSYTLRNRFEQLRLLTGMEMKRLSRSPIFWVIIGISILFLGIAQFANEITQVFGTPTLPVTYNMIDNIMGSMVLFILAILIFFSGQMIWRDRDSKVNELYDVMPVTNWLSFTSKYLSLAILPFLILILGIIISVIFQLANGYTRIELDVYIKMLLGFRMINFQLFLVLCLLVQVMTPNKYLGFFASVILFFFFGTILPLLGVEERLFRFMSGYRLTYSDMNGFGPFVKPFMAYKTYWIGFSVILLVLANALYPRGTEQSLKRRFRQLKDNFTLPAWTASAIGLALFIGMGSYIFYNTRVLNEYTKSEENNRQQALYEKRYKQYENIPKPRIIAVDVEVDLYPEKRDYAFRGTYLMHNETDQLIDSIHIQAGLDSGLEFETLSLDRPYDVVLQDDTLSYRIYRLQEPLSPGDSITLNFEADYITKGFPASGMNTQIVENGTFFTSFLFPAIGYQGLVELGSKEIRKKYDLAEKPGYAERTDTAALMNTLFGNDADWIDFEATVSTSPDQIALAPGYLQKEWEENGRRYFHYKMDAPIVKFFNISSGRYAVMRDSFQTPAPDQKWVSLEIYHHPEHTYNLEGMMDGMKRSLEVFTREFGPYQHRQVRIIEFPRYASYAQSFPNTIPYSESSGFIVDVDEGDVDLPLYGAAHEIAHQWWGHQLVSGNAVGFQFLIESMAQYSSILVMEEVLGTEKLRDYLKQERNNYLRLRSSERRKEKSLMTVEQQFYIQYQKGSLGMYALMDYIGKDTLNLAIRRYLDKVKFQEPPFTTTLDWMEEVEKVTPDSLKYALTDLFETITFHENEVLEASYKMNPDSTYTVDMKVLTKKTRDDGYGNESPADPHALIEVGIFSSKRVKRKREEKTLYLQKHWFDQDTTNLSFVVDDKPTEVAIDPYIKLIDRNSRNNRLEPTELGEATETE